MIMALAHLTLATRDVGRSAAFFAEAMDRLPAALEEGVRPPEVDVSRKHHERELDRVDGTFFLTG
jgi:hypothetical protein